MLGQQTNRILLVDDDEVIRKLTARHLIAAGHVVRTAEDGLDAIAKLRAGLPDLIISDLNMPGMSGFEFLGVVRKRFPQVPVIATSGLSENEIPEGLAADAYLRKNGFGFQPLLETISALTRKLPLRTSPPHIDNKPVRAVSDGNGHYTITCNDCLRNCSVPEVADIIRGEKWTTCNHCGNFVRFVEAGTSPVC